MPQSVRGCTHLWTASSGAVGLTSHCWLAACHSPPWQWWEGEGERATRMTAGPAKFPPPPLAGQMAAGGGVGWEEGGSGVGGCWSVPVTEK